MRSDPAWGNGIHENETKKAGSKQFVFISCSNKQIEQPMGHFKGTSVSSVAGKELRHFLRCSVGVHSDHEMCSALPCATRRYNSREYSGRKSAMLSFEYVVCVSFEACKLRSVQQDPVSAHQCQGMPEAQSHASSIENINEQVLLHYTDAPMTPACMLFSKITSCCTI